MTPRRVGLDRVRLIGQDDRRPRERWGACYASLGEEDGQTVAVSGFARSGGEQARERRGAEGDV